ncbi:MAG TPA: RNA methyltransferase [Thermoanaerobaculia bacterium]|nr:RNA methyltransferase [Thermoanaerobaculia bacterium]
MAMLRVILVEPREAGNAGAVARAMKNFGFDELWIVGEHPPLLPVAGWWASGADDLLASVRFAATLEEALAGAHVSVATTSMRGRTTPVTFTPRTLAGKFVSLAAGQTLALVFGREDSGLTREELVLCQHTAAIPTNDRFPTMNLAQSVCVFCYELSTIAPAPVARELADAALVERLHQRARELLLQVGFLHENNPDRIYDDLRAILARADLDEREVTIALGVIRQIEWALRAASSSGALRSDTPR